MGYLRRQLGLPPGSRRRPSPRPSSARLVAALVTTAFTLARAFTRRALTG